MLWHVLTLWVESFSAKSCLAPAAHRSHQNPNISSKCNCNSSLFVDSRRLVMMDIFELPEVNLFTAKRMPLVKNELEAPGCTNGDVWKELKNIYDWGNRKEMTTEQQSRRIFAEKYQYRNAAGWEHNKGIFPYWERCCLGDPSKQLNMRRLQGWDDAFKGYHINHNYRHWGTTDSLQQTHSMITHNGPTKGLIPQMYFTRVYVGLEINAS